MPKVVKPNKIKEQRPVITVCPHCECTVSYHLNEVHKVDNNGMGIICPNCGKNIVTQEVKCFTFPNSFYHFGSNDDSVCLTNEEIQKYVDIVKNTLQHERKVGEYTFTGSGNTMVFGFKFEDEDVIIVAKDYWEDSEFKTQ